MKALFIVSILFLTFSGCSQGKEEKAAINRLNADLYQSGQADSIYHLIKYFPDDTQFSISVIQGDQINYIGLKRDNDTIINIENHQNAFEIGSITKVFTSTILADFIIKNELNPDDKINTYFEFPFNKNQEFTFRELANHTSGLPRLPSNIRFAAMLHPKNPYKGYDEKKLDEYLKNSIEPEYSKGSKSEYSNLGVGLLSYALRKYSRKTYEQLLTEKIFQKYNMNNSASDKEKIENILISGLGDDGMPTPNWESGALIGAGGVYATIEDLTKFAMAQFDSTNLELKLTRAKTFEENSNNDVGLGWFIINRKNGDKWYWHNGRTGGYTSCMVIDVKNRKGVIILSNISAYHKHSKNIDNLCFSLLKSL